MPIAGRSSCCKEKLSLSRAHKVIQLKKRALRFRRLESKIAIIDKDWPTRPGDRRGPLDVAATQFDNFRTRLSLP